MKAEMKGRGITSNFIAEVQKKQTQLLGEEVWGTAERCAWVRMFGCMEVEVEPQRTDYRKWKYIQRPAYRNDCESLTFYIYIVIVNSTWAIMQFDSLCVTLVTWNCFLCHIFHYLQHCWCLLKWFEYLLKLWESTSAAARQPTEIQWI